MIEVTQTLSVYIDMFGTSWNNRDFAGILTEYKVKVFLKIGNFRQAGRDREYKLEIRSDR